MGKGIPRGDRGAALRYVTEERQTLSRPDRAIDLDHAA
jgi:hypothetical protein